MSLFERLLLGVFILYLSPVFIASQEISLDDLDWRLSSCDGRISDVKAHVPGNVHLDLQSAGVLDGDPYFRFNEIDFSWVAETCWRYSAVISADRLLKSSSDEYQFYIKTDRIDTFGTIYLGSQVIGRSRNMFRTYYFGPIDLDADHSLADEKSSDQTTTTTISIEIESALVVAKGLAKDYPYEVPATSNYHVWAEPTNRNFVRKAGSDFGWDWGPAFVPVGIYGGISIVYLTRPRLEHIIVHQHFEPASRSSSTLAAAADSNNANLSTVSLEISMYVRVPAARFSDHSCAGYASVYLNGDYKFAVHLLSLAAVNASTGTSGSTTNVDNTDGNNGSVGRVIYLGSVSISDALLWWPRGLGPQHLYTVQVRLISSSCSSSCGSGSSSLSSLLFQQEADSGGREGIPSSSSSSLKQQQQQQLLASLVQSKSVQVGIRSIDLIQQRACTSSTSSSNGSSSSSSSRSSCSPSFLFRINNEEVFIRGANIIPLDVFHSRVTSKDREYLLLAAARANMNMVRVWGGGIYQPDDFYALADRLGIMVWQEFAFACALYPRNDEFLNEVREEVKEQIIRLGSHPSIVVWGGNNEVEASLDWFQPSKTDRDIYIVDYVKLFVDTIYDTVKRFDGNSSSSSSSQRAWVDSSPSNGIISENPYVKRWGPTSTSTRGDMHFYSYDCDCEDPSSFPSSLFVSEFGFQSFPSFSSLLSVTLPIYGDWSIDSEFMQFRQRHEHGNDQIRKQIERHFRAMDVSKYEGMDKDQGQQQLFDDYLFLSQIQQSRCYETAISRWRRPVADGGSMGVIYWQFNDIWQGTSWSSIEWNGKMKPLYYTIQRSYAPIALGIVKHKISKERRGGGDSGSNESYQSYDCIFDIYFANDNNYNITINNVELCLLPWDTIQDHRSPGSEQSYSGSACDFVVYSLSTVSIEKHHRVSFTAILNISSSSSSSSYNHGDNDDGYNYDDYIRISSQGSSNSSRRCRLTTCYLRLSAELATTASNTTSSNSNTRNGNDADHTDILTSTQQIIYPTYEYLAPFKDIHLQRPSLVKLDNFTSLSPYLVSFTLSVDCVTPFLYLEMTSEGVVENRDDAKQVHGVINGAGWFSMNNFLAEPYVEYLITYTAVRGHNDDDDDDDDDAAVILTAVDVKDRITVRSLNSLFFVNE